MAEKKKFKAIKKTGNGKAEVISKKTGKPLDKHPIPVARAKRQLGAIEASKHGDPKFRKGK